MMSDCSAIASARSGIVHLHLVGANAGMKTVVGPLVASRYGGFSCHNTVEDFQMSVPSDDWGVVLVELPEGKNAGNAERVRQTHPDFRLIMTAYRPSVDTVIQALRAGVSDFFELPATPTELIDALTRALRQAWCDHVVRQQSKEADRRLSALTRRESDVLGLLITGETSKQIARQLGLSHRTVEYFRARIFAKTGVDSVADLTRMHAAARARLDAQASGSLGASR